MGSDPIQVYSNQRPIFERFAEHISDLIGEYCGKSLIHTTECRAKSVNSFQQKSERKDDEGKLKYSDPLKEITDLSAVRIIVFVRSSVDLICQEIGKILEVIEIEDVGDRVYSRGKFGYQSKHLLIRLGPDRRALVENSNFKDMVCEVQVRTLLQHAWAEMEHDIQYKSEQEIPLDLKKRFSALAGVLEIADREFQSIQRDSEILKQTVRADLIDNLTQQGIAGQGDLAGEHGAETKQAAVARDLVRQERYGDAIEIYSRKIEYEPTSFTLYLGRARARFLAGDVRGSLADLDQVEKLTGDPKHTARLRAIVEQGEGPAAILASIGAVPDTTATNLGLKEALDALRSGDGVRAYDRYTTIEASGYNKAFAMFGKAMCCAVENDPEGARTLLSLLELRPSTPMSVNICTLLCVLAILEGRNIKDQQAALDKAISEFPTFNLAFSHLQDLRAGLRARGYDNQDEINHVFSKLEHDIR